MLNLTYILSMGQLQGQQGNSFKNENIVKEG